ncbi:hypothetical protein EV193_1011076 [Herbihabitans rhizosphaerae]|uniref:Uncharacterized protein n=1 Tax=Herbihabitans rhizosphaerae TaxID=1872711 RepID=A0A4Q7L677_9PSEU|nr:hypothetical protein EV193_1011076 [Herbihabitans rhizosphaerae]
MWVDKVYDDNDEEAYRTIYFAYLKARGRSTDRGGEADFEALPDGGYLLRDRENELRLADDTDREAFVAYLVERCCGSRFKDMAEWENRMHDVFMDDLRFL